MRQEGISTETGTEAYAEVEIIFLPGRAAGSSRRPGEERGARLSRIYIEGPSRLEGSISLQGSKNAALPMMAAALLHKGVTVLSNVPMIRDVDSMAAILRCLGCRVQRCAATVIVDASYLRDVNIPDIYMKQMRSSVILMGALLGRTGEGECSYPGGCLIGSRPIDIHLQVLQDLGARISEKDGRIHAHAPQGMKGADIRLRYPSVGATEQAVLGAVLAQGETMIQGAAKEPEIGALCRCLCKMGAKILGAGTDRIIIQGVGELRDCSVSVDGDRIVAGTYLSAVMSAGGKVRLMDAPAEQLELPIRYLRQAGALVDTDQKRKEICISMEQRPRGLRFQTGPYPGFPTDLQSVFMAFLASAAGTSQIEEKVFEGRFATAKELEAMGADIQIHEGSALIRGRWPLKGCRTTARDLRGGAALIVAGLGAAGRTIVEDPGHISRGYEDICRDLSALGAKIHQE